MKLRTATNFALVAVATTTILSGGYLAYEDNVGGIKQDIVQSHRRRNNLTTVTDQLNPTQIKRKVTTDQVKNDNLHKLGVVSIPSLQINLPIYDQPYSSEALKKGAQHLKSVNSQKVEVDNAIGTGNYILVAHNYNDGHTMFSALQQNINKDAPYLVNGKVRDNNWLNGKIVYLANDQGIFKYQIENQSVLLASDTSVRKESKDAELNIITCLFPSDQYRIDTKAKLVGMTNWNQATNQELKAVGSNFNLKK